MKAVNPGTRFPKVKGIYAITNKLTGDCYVGAGHSLRQRVCFNFYVLELGRHSNKYLQKDWNKFGRDNFDFVILETEPESLQEAEQCWIDQARRNNKCYNIYMAGWRPKRKNKNKISA